MRDKTRNVWEESICLITGATSGIGNATAYRMAERGFAVVLVGRNEERCARTIKEIKEYTGNKAVDYLVANLAAQRDIYALASQFRSRYSRLHVLVNNAGTVSWSRQFSPDGIELTFAVNHLSYFLLTNLLLDVLKSSAPARVINVSSVAHTRAEINLEEVGNPNHYRGFQAYCQSKLANLMFTYELARRLQGTGVTVNAVHPGVVATNLLSNGKVPVGRLTRPIIRTMLRIVGRNLTKGSDTTVYLATAPEITDVTGKYFVDRTETFSSQGSYDVDMASRLWELSARLTNLSFEQSGI